MIIFESSNCVAKKLIHMFKKKDFNHICYFNFSFNYTPISDIGFYLHVIMETHISVIYF